MRIIDLFDRGCSFFPDRPFLPDHQVSFSHREVQDMSHRIVNGLIDGGLTPGKSVVGVLNPNNLRAFQCGMGALRSFVWLPLDARRRRRTDAQDRPKNQLNKLRKTSAA